MTSVQAGMKPFLVKLDTTWPSGELFRGEISVVNSQFQVKNYDRKTHTSYEYLILTVGSGRFGCSLRLRDPHGNKSYVEFGSDIDQFLNRDKIVADVEAEIKAMKEERDTDNDWQRIKWNITASFCDELKEIEHLFAVDFDDCHLFGGDCQPVPMRVRGGGTVDVNSWWCSYRITPKVRNLFFDDTLTEEPQMDIEDPVCSHLYWNPDFLPPSALEYSPDDLPAFGSVRAVRLWRDYT